jgi:hypothetical protein
MRAGWEWGWVVIVPALLTSLCDVAEGVQILRMLRVKSNVSARGFGRAKWFFYFATIAAEGFLFFVVVGASAFREAAGMLFGLALIAPAIGGVISALKGSFEDISSATRLSALALFGLASAPLLALYCFSWGETAQYAVFLRVPLLLGLALLALPFVAFFSGAKTLLRGLFDLTPPSLFVVTLAALATAGTVCTTASVVIKNGAARFGVGHGYTQTLLPAWGWLVIMAGLSLPVVGFSLWFSIKQGHNTRGMVIAALSGYYDNYGMATTVEWLDEALADARSEVKSVLVIQVHGRRWTPTTLTNSALGTVSMATPKVSRQTPLGK